MLSKNVTGLYTSVKNESDKQAKFIMVFCLPIKSAFLVLNRKQRNKPKAKPR